MPTEASAILETVLREQLMQRGRISLHEPEFAGNEWAYVKECLDVGWVSTAGGFVDRFERALASACNAEFAIATVTGTAALHLALRATGVGPGDAVLCPALTFVATVNAISYCGATPIFVDSDPETLGLSTASVGAFLATACERNGSDLYHAGSGARIGAIVPVHIFGHPADMDDLNERAADAGLPVVEDATEALGSRYRGRPAGTLGTVGVLSFNGNKTITSGGGGAVLTNDADIARLVRHLSTTARIGGGWQHDHDMVGYNYRLPNINAALGLAQLERIDNMIARKRRLAAIYEAAFADCGDGVFFREPPWAQSNYWLNALRLQDRAARDAFLDATNTRGIGTRPCWRLICDLPMYRNAPRADDLAGARESEERLVNLPSSPALVRAEENAPLAQPS